MTDGKKHHKYGGSNAHRWLECPGSVKHNEGRISETSKYAEEGIRAHEYGEKFLRGEPIPETWFKEDQEFRDAVTLYVDTIRAIEGELFVEVKFNLYDIHPDMGGTADAVKYNPKKQLLTVGDYKHGAGVPVEVIDNKQQKFYALGAMKSLGVPVKEVELVIIQPRAEHPDGVVRRQRLHPTVLTDFELDLKDAVAKAEAETPEFVVGDHCHWCPGRHDCPAQLSGIEAMPFVEVLPSLTPKRLSELLALADKFEDWCGALREYAHREAEAGRTPPGYKLVEKRASRQWRDEEAVRSIGIKQKIDIWEPRTLKSPAGLEKEVGKKEFKVLFESVVKRESSGYNLVHESAKGEPVMLNPVKATDVFEAVDEAGMSKF